MIKLVRKELLPLEELENLESQEKKILHEVKEKVSNLAEEEALYKEPVKKEKPKKIPAKKVIPEDIEEEAGEPGEEGVNYYD
jgi:hypothetical protein